MKQRVYLDRQVFTGDITSAGDTVTNLSIDTRALEVGQVLAATGLSSGTTVDEILGPDSVRIVPAATATTVGVSITGRQQTNNVFFLHCPDGEFGGGATANPASNTERNFDIPVSGPGSDRGWGGLGFYREAGVAAYAAVPGSYYVGGQVPYTDAGLLNNQPADLNRFGVTNNAFRVRSNSVQHDLKGSEWWVSSANLVVRESGVNAAGTSSTKAGADFFFDVQAFRSSGAGSVYGNAVQRFYAPKNNTPIGETTVAGYIVAPGNGTDPQSSVFFGANPSGTPDLTGDRAALRALASNIELYSSNRLSGWKSGAEWFRLSGDTSGNGASFIRESVNNLKQFDVSNANTGTLATAVISATQTGVQNTGVNMQVYGTGFTPVGSHDLADGAAVYSGAGLSAGLTVGALAGDLRLQAAGHVSFGTHSAVGAETVTGYITIKDAGGALHKLAVIS